MFLDTLLFDIQDTPLAPQIARRLMTVHVLGAVAIARLSHEWLWLGLPLLWFALPAYISLRQSSTRLFLETVTPMFLAYGVISTRVLLVGISRLQLVTNSRLTEFDRYGDFLDITTATMVSLLWIALIQAIILARYHNVQITWQRGLRWLAYGLLAFTIVWAIWAYLAIRARGVTASDPYAYVQMGYDLATSGSLQHTFDLTSIAAQDGLDLEALAPIGYTVPDSETGQAATVWAPGFSVFLAAAYTLFGESGFYLLTPLAGVLTLLITVLLSQETLRLAASHERWLSSALAAFVLATSLVQILWLAVPMADIPSQLFTTLSIYFALICVRTTRWQLPFLAGLGLGIAFAVRYTQVLVGLSIVAGWSYIFLHQRKNLQQWLKVIVPAGIGAWLVAIPVLYYHSIAFGGAFEVGSEELKIFGATYILDSGWRMLVDAFSVDEFLLLFPFILWGSVRLWQLNRLASIVLNVWLFAIVAFHLPYAALRLRDLLSVYPILAIYTGLGITDLLVRLGDLRFPRLARAVFIWLLIILFWVRTEETLGFIDGVFNNFGYLNKEQRMSFDVMQRITTDDVIIAASLNSGPIILYSELDSVRPYEWHKEEWFTFIDETDDHPLYILVDGVEMQSVFDITKERYTLELVTLLPMPYFYVGAGSENQLVALYKLNRG